MPYSLTSYKPEVSVFGANSVGLERRGFSKESIESLQTALRLLTRSNLNTSQAIERIRAEVPPGAEVDELLEFIRASGARSGGEEEAFSTHQSAFSLVPNLL